MPRAPKLLLLIPALAVLLCAAEARAVVQGEDREEIRTLAQAVAGEKKKDSETWFRLGIEYNRGRRSSSRPPRSTGLPSRSA